jgi:hypothetical protein
MKHTCGKEMRKATRTDIYNTETSDAMKKELIAGDYGKIWICDTCKKLVFC